MHLPPLRRRHRGADGEGDVQLTQHAYTTADFHTGMRVKDACAQVVEATAGAPSKRELYDAVLRSRG